MLDYTGDFHEYEERLISAGCENKVEDLYNLSGATRLEIEAMVDYWVSTANKGA